MIQNILFVFYNTQLSTRNYRISIRKLIPSSPLHKYILGYNLFIAVERNYFSLSICIFFLRKSGKLWGSCFSPFLQISPQDGAQILIEKRRIAGIGSVKLYYEWTTIVSRSTVKNKLYNKKLPFEHFFNRNFEKELKSKLILYFYLSIFFSW